MIIGESGKPRSVSGLQTLNGMKRDCKPLRRDGAQIGYIADTKTPY